MVKFGCIFPAVDVISVHSQGPEMKAMVPIPPKKMMDPPMMTKTPMAAFLIGRISMFIIQLVLKIDLGVVVRRNPIYGCNPK